MTDADQHQLRAYAAGDLAWRTLREEGWRYADVLAGLGTLGLRPPRVREHGPNAAALDRGTRTMRRLLAAADRP